MAAHLTGENFIGAERVRGTSGTLWAVDPRDGSELLPTYGLAGPQEVRRAAALAASAFPSYRQTNDAARAAFLHQIAANLEGVADDLVERVADETALDEARIRGELRRTLGQIRLFGEVLQRGTYHSVRIEHELPDRLPSPRPDLRQRRIPLGPVAVFGASNFPLAFSVAGGDTISALAAGCPVVVKAHGSHPGTSEIVASAIQRAVDSEGLHEGVFSMLFGDPEPVAVPLVMDPAIKVVCFTGSRNAGTALASAISRRREPIPIFAEMSSVNPVLLLPGAMAERWPELAEGFVQSLLIGVGQLCTNPGLVLGIDCPEFDDFLNEVAGTVRQAPAGVMLNRGIAESYWAGIARLRCTQGVTEVAVAEETGTHCFAAALPSVFTTSAVTFRSRPELQNEVFGPASLIVRVGSLDELISLIDLLEGQLTCTVHGADADSRATAILLPHLELKAGRLVFDGWPTGVDVGEAMVHGGPYPATTDPRTTSVGTLAIERFLRPVVYQSMPRGLHPGVIEDGSRATS